MTRILWSIAVVGPLVALAGCGTLCNRRPLCHRNDAPAKSVCVPPSPTPSPLVPAGAIGPPTAFPTAPPNPSFGQPAPFPTVPPNANTAPPNFAPPANAKPNPPMITPVPPANVPPRVESKWQPIENSEPAKPRVQLYAPEADNKEPPSSLPRKPSVQATFPPIAQFAEAKDNVYTGLKPSADGLDWLQANKIGAVMQVRLPDEDDAAIKKQVEDRGMRYVAFEVSPLSLTKEKADEFIKIIRDARSSGLFVYDQDGSLAGAMWYLQLRWGEVLDDDAAQLRARPLGLQNTLAGPHRDMWLAVQKLLSENSR